MRWNDERKLMAVHHWDSDENVGKKDLLTNSFRPKPPKRDYIYIYTYRVSNKTRLKNKKRLQKFTQKSVMKKVFSKDEVRRMANSSELRGVSDKLKRAALLNRMGPTQRQVADVLKLSQSSVKRAVLALKANREPGNLGRPRALSDEQEQYLINHLIARSNNKRSLSISELREAVGA
ncbi:MAG: hypothetical protein AB7K41_16190 [Bdellovibrionales bacterium]